MRICNLHILRSENVHPYICPEKEQNGVNEVRNRSISTRSRDFDQNIRKQSAKSRFSFFRLRPADKKSEKCPLYRGVGWTILPWHIVFFLGTILDLVRFWYDFRTTTEKNRTIGKKIVPKSYQYRTMGQKSYQNRTTTKKIVPN